MSSKNDNILEFSQFLKSDEMLYIIYDETKPVTEKDRWMYKL